MNIFPHHRATELVRHVILMPLIILLCYSDNALAESTEIQELKLEIEVLKKRIQELESAKSVNDPKVKTGKVTGNPWRSLQVNLSKAEVISLLGKPGKIHKWKTGEAWYYPNPKGGEVDFDANGNVSGWLDP